MAKDFDSDQLNRADRRRERERRLDLVAKDVAWLHESHLTMQGELGTLIAVTKQQSENMAQLTQTMDRHHSELFKKLGDLEVKTSVQGVSQVPARWVAIFVAAIVAIVGGASTVIVMHVHGQLGPVVTKQDSIIDRMSDDDDRNSRIADDLKKSTEEGREWRADHDKRVIATNTEQSTAIEYLERMMQLMWKKAYDGEAWPAQMPKMPRVHP